MVLQIFGKGCHLSNFWIDFRDPLFKTGKNKAQIETTSFFGESIIFHWVKQPAAISPTLALPSHLPWSQLLSVYPLLPSDPPLPLFDPPSNVSRNLRHTATTIITKWLVFWAGNPGPGWEFWGTWVENWNWMKYCCYICFCSYPISRIINFVALWFVAYNNSH